VDLVLPGVLSDFRFFFLLSLSPFSGLSPRIKYTVFTLIEDLRPFSPRLLWGSPPTPVPEHKYILQPSLSSA